LDRKVVAIADGGLENGAVAVSWAIPAKYLRELAASSESIETVQRGPRNPVLFSAEADTKNLGETTCSGLVLTRLRSTSFPQASLSADDPKGLFQLVQFFAVDPSAFKFDVYQHLKSGATFVLPTGAHLRQGPGGDCVATLTSGIVEMHLQLAVLRSAFDANSKSQEFERMMAGDAPQQWTADPQWTYVMPYPRFDEMIVRRRSYVHFRTMPYMVQDRYLFEILAVRKNVFIGSAAINAASPELIQRVTACRFSPNTSGCDDARALINEWVSAVLSIQLTTFPIG
jgi:hypothetical protein